MPAHLAADAHAVRCPSCARDVPEGNFCEHCGASLLAQPDPEVAEATPEIAKATLEVKFLSIAAFGAEDADMGLRLSRVPTGSGVLATSVREADGEHRTFAGQISVIYAASESQGEVAAEGIGLVTFTDCRVFGVLTDGKGRGGEVRLKVNGRGDGAVALFAFDRGIVDEVEERRSRAGKTTGVVMVGDVGGLVIDGFASMGADGSFKRTDNADLLAVARRFAGAEATATTAVAEAAPEPVTTPTAAVPAPSGDDAPCARCGAVPVSGSRFCGDCGAAVGGVAETTAVAPPPLPASAPPPPPRLPLPVAGPSASDAATGGRRGGRKVLVVVVALAVVAAAGGGYAVYDRTRSHPAAAAARPPAAGLQAKATTTEQQSASTVAETTSPTPEDTTTTTTESSDETTTEASSSAAPADPAVPRRVGPTETVRRHFERLNAGEYDEAFALMSPSYRRSQPQWPTLRAEARPQIRIVRVGPATVAGADARVHITFYARDQVAVEHSDTNCRRFNGVVHLVRVHSTWRYDPGPNQLTAAVLPGTNSRCP